MPCCSLWQVIITNYCGQECHRRLKTVAQFKLLKHHAFIELFFLRVDFPELMKPCRDNCLSPQSRVYTVEGLRVYQRK